MKVRSLSESMNPGKSHFWGTNIHATRNPKSVRAKTETVHPGRLTAGTYSHHPFRKENDLNQTYMIMFQPLIFRSVVAKVIHFLRIIRIHPGRVSLHPWHCTTQVLSLNRCRGDGGVTLAPQDIVIEYQW